MSLNAPAERPAPKFSVITCTHRPDYYRENVVATLANQLADGELIEVDNCDHRISVPAALNEGRSRARGEILVFCHHDIRFPEGWVALLEQRLAKLDAIDPHWGVAGLIGRSFGRRWVGNIVDEHIRGKLGDLPCEVQSLDEVCLILPRNSPLHFDEALGSMHFFGADICLQAREQGLKSYAVDAQVEHLSSGFRDPAFYETARKLQDKWCDRELAPHVIHTTCGTFRIRNSIMSMVLSALSWLEMKIRRVRARLGGPQSAHE